jgi:curved DNA-binding protein CbpA
MAMDDYYQLLDVAPDAPRDDIREAFRTKRDALQAQEGDGNRGKVAQLNRAWNVLSDPAQRERYDDRLAEHRESGASLDEYEGEDGADDTSGPRTKAQQRADARRARQTRQPTIVMPEGFTQASTKARLFALGFDLLVLLGIFLAVYQVGLGYVDHKFPGKRSEANALITKRNDASTRVSADKKKVSDANAAKNTAAAKSAQAKQATDQKAVDAANARINAINKELGPTTNLVFVAGMIVLLIYLVPSSALTGQTLGKRLRHIRVVKVDGSPLGWSAAITRFGVPLLVGTILTVLMRTPLGLAVAVLGIVGWISNPNRQGLHDRLAKTIVVEA